MLFSFDELMEYEPLSRLEEIFRNLDLQPLENQLPKHALGCKGHSKLSMVRALIAKQIESIPGNNRLVERLKQDPVFRYVCGFPVIKAVPSESTFSRLFTKLSNNEALSTLFNDLVKKAIESGIINGSTIAIDSTEIDAYEKSLPKKKLINDGAHANWGSKHDTNGNQTRWYGYKLHLSCDTSSELPISFKVTPANANDSKVAIPLMEDLVSKYPGLIHPRYYVMDGAYDTKEIHDFVWKERKSSAIIPLSQRNTKQPPLGMDLNGTPICSNGYPMVYWGFDRNTGTKKFRCPHVLGKADCSFGSNWCSPSNYGMVVKQKIDDDPRRHSVPHRGTDRWQKLYNLRTSVERCFSRLKEYLSANNLKVRGIEKVTAHLLLNLIALVAGTLAVNHKATKAA